MEALYSTIFVAVVALFGVLVAALIYVAQTVQDRYSTKLAQRLLKGRLALPFLLCGLVTLVLASLGLFAVGYPCPLGFPLSALTSTICFGGATFVGVFLTLLSFAVTLRSYARLLSPLSVLREMARDLSPYSVRDIALVRFHRETPAITIADGAFLELMRQIRGTDVATPVATTPTDVVGQGLLRKALCLWKRVTKTRRITGPQKRARLKKKLAARERSGNLEDPLTDLFEYGLTAVDKNNELAWRAFLRRLVDVFADSARIGLLKRDCEIPFLGDLALTQGLERLGEEISISQRYSLLVPLADSVKEICDAFASANSWERIPVFLTFLQDIGAQALHRRDRAVFQSAVQAITQLGIHSLKNERESPVFDDACRKIGWLGEKLILRGIDDAPIMPSGDETEELSAISESLYRLSAGIREDKTDKYPLILRDAIEVICDQALKRKEPQKLESTVQSLFGISDLGIFRTGFA
jgi:hypothetical protein